MDYYYDARELERRFVKPLTRKDMYDKNGKCILPIGEIPKSMRDRSKYIPSEEDRKHIRRR